MTAFSHTWPLDCFSYIPCTNKGHTMSSKVCIQIWRSLKMFATHLTAQWVLLLRVIGCRRLRGRRGRRRGILFIAVVRRSCWGQTEALVIGGRVSHFVHDEAMAWQWRRGCKTGTTLQTLQVATCCPSSPVLADVLQEGRLLLCDIATVSAAKSGLGNWSRGWWAWLFYRRHSFWELFLRFHLDKLSLCPMSPQGFSLFRRAVNLVFTVLCPNIKIRV